MGRYLNLIIEVPSFSHNVYKAMSHRESKQIIIVHTKLTVSKCNFHIITVQDISFGKFIY